MLLISLCLNCNTTLALTAVPCCILLHTHCLGVVCTSVYKYISRERHGCCCIAVTAADDKAVLATWGKTHCLMKILYCSLS